MRRVGLFLVATLVMVMLLPGLALANAGPPTGPGDKGAMVLPGKSTTVHVLREWLRFELAGELDSARVTARYEMENRGGAAKVPAVFVIQDYRFGNSNLPVITWEGRPLEVTQQPSFADMAEEDRERMKEAWGGESRVIDPVSGERHDLYRYEGQGDAISYFHFTLDLPAGAKGMLEVTYQQVPGFEHNRYAHPVYYYQYLLLPARGWASFGPLEIEIQAPPSSKAFFASSLPLAYRDGAYRASLEGLPGQNLTFSFMSRRGLIGRIVQKGTYYWMALGLVLPVVLLVALGLGKAAARMKSRVGAIFTALGLGLFLGLPANGLTILAIFSLWPALADYGYGSKIMGALQFIAFVPITLALVMVSATRYHDRKPVQRRMVG